MTADPWRRLSDELAAQLRYLQNGDVVSLQWGARYIQVFQGPEGGSLETAANVNLPAEQRISVTDEKKLSNLGWEPPRPPDRHNWWIDYGLPLHGGDADRLAAVLVSTLREVLDAPHPGELHRESFNAFA